MRRLDSSSRPPVSLHKAQLAFAAEVMELPGSEGYLATSGPVVLNSYCTLESLQRA